MTTQTVELRMFKGDKFVISQHYDTENKIICPMSISSGFIIPELLKSNEYLYLLFAMNYALSE